MAMSKTVTRMTLLVCSVLCLPLFSAQAQQAQRTLTIEADEWCPINCKPNGNPQGIGIELARKVFEPLGYRVNYVVVPWSQALKDVRAGLADAVVGANTSDDPRLLFPSSAIATISDDFYVRKGDPWRYQGPHTLKGKRVGVITDYGYGDVLKTYVDEEKKKSGSVLFATGNDPLRTNMANLLAGKIDIIIESKIVMDYALLSQNMTDKIEWAGGIPQGTIYVAFSPALAASKERVRQYDAGIQALQKSGALAPMYKPYGMKP